MRENSAVETVQTVRQLRGKISYFAALFVSHRHSLFVVVFAYLNVNDNITDSTGPIDNLSLSESLVLKHLSCSLHSSLLRNVALSLS